MNRTQKKCVLASAGAHLLLVVILIIGPAFGSSRRKPDEVPLLDFVPYKTVDALVSGGGYRDGRPPQMAPVPRTQPPAPQPQAQPQPQPPEKQRDPDPPKEAAKEADPPEKPVESLVPSARPKRKPEVNMTLVKRKRSTDEAKTKAEARAREEARAYADSRRQIAREIGRLADRIGEETAGSTEIKLQGPGGGGVPYANFLQAVKTVYTDAWVVPDGVINDQATAVAAVTIARDGTVLRYRLVTRSGDSLVDHSVQATLERVKFAAPLPEDSKEQERTVTINFNVKAKQGIG